MGELMEVSLRRMSFTLTRDSRNELQKAKILPERWSESRPARSHIRGATHKVPPSPLNRPGLLRHYLGPAGNDVRLCRHTNLTLQASKNFLC